MDKPVAKYANNKLNTSRNRKYVTFEPDGDINIDETDASYRNDVYPKEGKTVVTTTNESTPKSTRASLLPSWKETELNINKTKRVKVNGMMEITKKTKQQSNFQTPAIMNGLPLDKGASIFKLPQQINNINSLTKVKSFVKKIYNNAAKDVIAVNKTNQMLMHNVCKPNTRQSEEQNTLQPPNNNYNDDFDDSKSVISIFAAPEIERYLDEQLGDVEDERRNVVNHSSISNKNNTLNNAKPVKILPQSTDYYHHRRRNKFDTLDFSYNNDDEGDDCRINKRNLSNCKPKSDLLQMSKKKVPMGVVSEFNSFDEIVTNLVDNNSPQNHQQPTQFNNTQERNQQVNNNLQRNHSADCISQERRQKPTLLVNNSQFKFPSPDHGSQLVLDGSAFENHCLEYMRTSVEKNKPHHICNKSHSLPFVQWNNPNEDRINKLTKAIELVICTGFVNPPLSLLKSFVRFGVKRAHKTLVNIGKSLKENVTLEFEINSTCRSIWMDFIEVLFTEADESVVNNTLEMIFAPNKEFDLNYLQIFQLVLECLVEVSKNSRRQVKTIQCVEFLRYLENPDQFSPSYYPMDFRLFVINQAVETAFSRFSFKVFKTFFEDPASVEELNNTNPRLVESLLEPIKHCHGVQPVLSRLRRGSSLSCSQSSNHKASCNNQPTKTGMSPNCRTQLSKAISQNTPNAIPMIKQLKTQGIDCKEIYNIFIALQNGQEKFEEILGLCADDLKQYLSNITFTFMAMEYNNNKMDKSFLFLKEIPSFEPLSVTDFRAECRTPTNKILMAIDACLKSNFLLDGLDLFILLETDDRLREGASEDDLLKRKHFCSCFENILKTQSIGPAVCCSLLIKLLPQQRSFKAPIDFDRAFGPLITKLLNEREGKEQVVNLVRLVIDLKLVDRMKLSRQYQLRVLVQLLWCEGLYNHASNLMMYQGPICSCYRNNINVDRIELDFASCLSEEEMLCIFKCRKVLNKGQLKGNITIKFKESALLEELKTTFRHVDCGVPAAMVRCVDALVKFGVPRERIIPGRIPNSLWLDGTLNYT